METGYVRHDSYPITEDRDSDRAVTAPEDLPPIQATKLLTLAMEMKFTLSKLDEFKFEFLRDGERLKERLLRRNVFLDKHLDTHIRGQIIQMDLDTDKRCRFPHLDDVALLALQDLSDYGRKSREISEVQGETFNTNLVSELLLPIYGFDSKKVTFWFRHQKVFRKIFVDEEEELLMVNRFIKLKMELVGYHSEFWALSDHAISALNILAHLVYSMNIPIKPPPYETAV